MMTFQYHSGTEDERISAIGEHTEKPPAGYILHHLHRCCQNLPNGVGQVIYDTVAFPNILGELYVIDYELI